MGKKNKKSSKKKKAQLKEFVSSNCKTNCCKKYKKSESKRCKYCPCYDFLKKVA